ncbi:hypothetical protein ACOMHN_064428 [Nucella lapillus]
MSYKREVSEGDHVVFKTADKSKVFQVNKTRQIFFEKTSLKGKEIAGQPYGTLFEVQRGKLVVVTSSEGEPSASTADGGLESGKDNRDLVASGENQKLTQEEIMKMKEEGLSGQDIVGKLVAQSETFKTKTEFSQEKYIKKKKKKHMLVFRILQPSSRLLLDTFKHCASKIGNLRGDSLSQLLNYSNMMSGSTVAVVESCQGLVLGAVMERLGGCGKVLHLYPGNDMNRHVVGQFNFPEDHMKTLHEFPLNKLASLEDGTLLSAADNASGQKGTASETAEKVSPPAECSGDAARRQDDKVAVVDSKVSAMEVERDSDSDAMEEGKGEEKEGKGETTSKGAGKRKGDRGQKRKPKLSPEEQEARKQLRAERLHQAAIILSEQNLDSLIIATKYDCVSLLQRLLPYVAPSRPVVIFSQHKEPLVECFTAVKENGLGIQLKLSESWYREYQVLPCRTHPLMSMSGTGGYLLSFIRVTSQQ